MRAPPFWWTDKPDGRALLLWPLGAVYGAVTAHRMARRGVRVGAPVLCVGNFVAGGAGKTPTAIAAARALRSLGERPFFLSRGYGARRRLNGVLRVDPSRHGAEDVGDEPLLLAAVAPTLVSADRVAGAQAAARAGASVVVMDDGLQNPTLHKDLALAVVDGESGVGNGLCIPAGPLRAPLDLQLDRVDAVLVIGHRAAGSAVAASAAADGLPTLFLQIRPDPLDAARLRGRRVVAFAGIGRPEKFFDTLRALGAEVVQARAFDDHHVFTPQERAALQQEAARCEALLVTTEKDHARMGRPDDVACLRIEVVPESAEDFVDLLRLGLKRARAG